MQQIISEISSEQCKLDESKILVGDLENYEVLDDDEELPSVLGLNSKVILFVDNREKRNN